MKKFKLFVVTMMVIIPLLVTSCVQQVTEAPVTEVEETEEVVEETEEVVEET